MALFFVAMDCVVPAMAFYGFDTQLAWRAVPDAVRQRMLETVPYFQQIAVNSSDAAQVRALVGHVAKLEWVERYVDVEHEARRAVCLMDAMPMAQVWARLKDEVFDERQAVVWPTGPPAVHPQFWALVELVQRALVYVEIGHDGMTAEQMDRLRVAAQSATTGLKQASQVPHAVAELLLALKPTMDLSGVY